MSDAHIASPLPPPVYSETDQKVLPIVVYALYLLGFVTHGAATLVGVILAYVFRTSAPPIAQTHYSFLIRTFWLGVAALLACGVLLVVGIPLSLVLIGVPLVAAGGLGLVAVAIWFGVRCAVGLIRAAQDEPYPTPTNWVL